jgi:hypothetical protein
MTGYSLSMSIWVLYGCWRVSTDRNTALHTVVHGLRRKALLIQMPHGCSDHRGATGTYPCIWVMQTTRGKATPLI